jgi:hypothetical protein
VGPYGEEQLVGFITAKTVFLHECEVTVSNTQQQQQQQQQQAPSSSSSSSRAVALVAVVAGSGRGLWQGAALSHPSEADSWWTIVTSSCCECKCSRCLSITGGDVVSSGVAASSAWRAQGTHTPGISLNLLLLLLLFLLLSCRTASTWAC